MFSPLYGKYEIKFGIEEKSVGLGDRGNSWVNNVTAVSNPDVALKATMAVSGRAYDGAYCSFDSNSIMSDSTQITVSDATITGENQVTFKFSHSVNLIGGDSNDRNYKAYFRYVNENNILYQNDIFGAMMVNAYLDYADEAATVMTAHIWPNSNPKLAAYDRDDLLKPTGTLKEFMDANPGRWVLVIEEKSNIVVGQIDGFGGVDGHIMEPQKHIPGWNDGLYIEIVGKPIEGDLSVTKYEIISDTQVRLTFSAPVEILKVDEKTYAIPYVSLRLFNSNHKLLFWNPVTEEYTTTEAMLDSNGKRVYKDLDGNYTTETEGKNENGEIVKYKAQSNTPVQWTTTWEWGNKEHTKILYTFSGVKDMPANNLPDMLAYDWDQIQEGAFLGFDFEEKYDGVKIDNDNHVQNLFRADNPEVCLNATFFPHNLDSVMWRLKEDMVWAYTPQNITAKAQVISDTQIRVVFSQAIDMEYMPYFAVRMVDKEGNLMWNVEPNLSSPYQWTGTREWEDESHRSIIWTMSSNGMLGGNTMHNLANWVGVLQKYKDSGTWMFAIEEKDRDGFKVGRHNGLVDNISSKDGTIHLLSTYSAGLDGILIKLDTSHLVGSVVTLVQAQAIDDQTITLTFSESVAINDMVSMGVRYLTPSGDSEVLVDGRTAYFKGTWEYADDTKKVITWKLNSKHADNLTDIIQYNGNFKWNQGARVAFVIMDDEENQLDLNTLRIQGVTYLAGFRRLTGNYKTEKAVMSQLDIEIMYDLPGQAQDVDVIEYITNYLPFIILLCITTVVAPVITVVVCSKRKKNR